MTPPLATVGDRNDGWGPLPGHNDYNRASPISQLPTWPPQLTGEHSPKTIEKKPYMLETPRKWLYEWSTRRKAEHRLAELDQFLRTEDAILLVHQMGRAGSMTTVNSLRKIGVGLPVYHTHWLNPESVQRRMKWVNHLPESRRPLNVRVGQKLTEELQRDGTSRRHWNIVTVFREPIARNVSVFFLSIDAFVEDFERRYRSGELDHAKLLEIFLERFPHEQPLDWFDREMRDVFDIDVYTDPFPQDQGYQILRTRGADLLLIKLEQLDHCHAEAFRDFLGIDMPGLAQTHITEKDPSRPMYKDFVRQAVLPDEYLDRMYQSRFARHFYTDTELAGFRKKWSSSTP